MDLVRVAHSFGGRSKFTSHPIFESNNSLVAIHKFTPLYTLTKEYFDLDCINY